MYQISAKDFSGNDCMVSVVNLISDAIRIFWAVGFSVDLIDLNTGEVLMCRNGSNIGFSIFASDPYQNV